MGDDLFTDADLAALRESALLPASIAASIVADITARQDHTDRAREWIKEPRP